MLFFGSVNLKRLFLKHALYSASPNFSIQYSIGLMICILLISSNISQSILLFIFAFALRKPFHSKGCHIDLSMTNLAIS